MPLSNPAEPTGPPSVRPWPAPSPRERNGSAGPFWWAVGVPPGGEGVCRCCHGPSRSRFDVCFCCARVRRALRRPLAPIVPISIYRTSSPLHALLRGYKDAPVADARRRFDACLGALTAVFLAGHHACLSSLVPAGYLEVVTLVPGRRQRRASPLEPLLARSVARLGAPDDGTRLRWSPGVLGHRSGPPPRLEAPEPALTVHADRRSVVVGRDVLVVDDTMTTGVTLQHAAAALRTAGARSVVGLVLGRAVRPEVSDTQARYWERARSTDFTMVRCAAPGCGARGAGPAAGAQCEAATPNS